MHWYQASRADGSRPESTLETPWPLPYKVTHCIVHSKRTDGTMSRWKQSVFQTFCFSAWYHTISITIKKINNRNVSIVQTHTPNRATRAILPRPSRNNNNKTLPALEWKKSTHIRTHTIITNYGWVNTHQYEIQTIDIPYLRDPQLGIPNTAPPNVSTPLFSLSKNTPGHICSSPLRNHKKSVNSSSMIWDREGNNFLAKTHHTHNTAHTFDILFGKKTAKH